MGHYWALAKDPTVQPLRAWVEEIPNDGLIRFFTMFNKERVAIVSPSTLAEVLVHKCYDFEKPELFRRGLVRILGLGLVLAEGDVHKVTAHGSFLLVDVDLTISTAAAQGSHAGLCIQTRQRSVPSVLEQVSRADASDRCPDRPQQAIRRYVGHIS